MELPTYHPFRSEQAKEEYLTYYDERAKGWPVAHDTRMVETSFGQTFVRVNGPDDAPPLVLLPGAVFNSLMWIPNIEALSAEFQTFALDNIYDCGRSIYTLELKSPEDFVQWLDKLFTALNLGDHINLMGLSYGSWLTHQYALHNPQRLDRIVLLAHPAIVRSNPGFIVRIMLSFLSSDRMSRFVYWLLEDTANKDDASRKLLAGIVGDMQLAAKCFKPKRTVIPKIMKDDELHGLEVPALFLMGENEKTFPYQKAVQRINRLAPHVKTEVIPHAGHDLNLVQAQLINGKVLAFLKHSE